MAIMSAPAPMGLKQLAAAEASAVDRARSALDATAEAGGGSARASAPLPIYSIPLEALAYDEAAFDRAQLHGWRVLTEDAAGRRLVDFAGTEPTRASAVRRAGAAELLVRASLMAAERDTGTARYEPRVLDLGRLGFSALWLHSDDAPDRFFTLEERPQERTAEQLLADVSPRARRRLGSGNEAGGAAAIRGFANELGG